MNRPFSFAACASLGLLAFVAAPAVGGPIFSVGNADSNVTFDDFPGQSFSPAVSGNAGTGAAPGSGPVSLISFSIGYVTPINAGTLYVFDREYTGMPAGLATLTIGGPEGLLGTSLSVTANVFSFGSGLTLPDVNAVYFAYSDVSDAYLSDEFDGSAYGGATLQSFFAAPPSDPTFTGMDTTDEDIVFSAAFMVPSVVAPVGVPEPSTLALSLTCAAVLGLCQACRRRRSAA